MDSQPQTGLARSGEDGAGLVLGEGVRRVRLAEDVGPLRVGRAGFQHRSRDEIQVCRPLTPRFRWHDVRAEKRCLRGEFARDVEGSGLVLDSEAVAALDLDRRRALVTHLADPSTDELAQPFVGGGPGGSNGDADASTVVALPRHPRGELRRAVAVEDEVAVAVDEAGEDRPALEVDTAVGVWSGGRVADPGDAAVLDDQRGVGAQPEPGVTGAVTRDQLADPRDHHGTSGVRSAHWALLTATIASATTSSTGPRGWTPLDTIRRPPTTTSVMSAPVAPKMIWAGATPPVRRLSVRTATTSARDPTAIRPPSQPRLR